MDIQLAKIILSQKEPAGCAAIRRRKVMPPPGQSSGNQGRRPSGIRDIDLLKQNILTRNF